MSQIDRYLRPAVVRPGLRRVRKRLATTVKGQRVHFLHIGKTGGSAVRYALRDVDRTRRYRLILHRHGTTLADVAPGEPFVVFVRDPIARFVSGFYSRWRCGQPRIFIGWSEAEAAAFARFETPNQLGLALFAADPSARVDAWRAMQAIGHVRDSYLKWFQSADDLRRRSADLLFLGYQETLDADFEKLKSLVGLDAGIRLPRDDVQAHKNPAHLDTHLENAAIDNLRAWYAADYEILEVCRELKG